MRGEKAEADSNENETDVFSWITAQKNLVETRGKNWWVRVWSNMYFLTWVIGQKHIRDSKTDVSLSVERGSVGRFLLRNVAGSISNWEQKSALERSVNIQGLFMIGLDCEMSVPNGCVFRNV